MMKKLTVVSLFLSLTVAGCAYNHPSYENSWEQMEQESKRRVEEANREKANKERLRNEQAKTADFGEYPENYKEIVQKYMQLSLRDPDSARYRFASEPNKVNSFTDNSATENDVFCYEVAVFINAKNGYGGYSGEKVYFMYIKNGQVIGELGGN